VYKVLEELELLMVRANELTEFRIDAVLKEMATTTLCQLPQEEPWTVEEFLENTQVTNYISWPQCCGIITLCIIMVL